MAAFDDAQSLRRLREHFRSVLDGASYNDHDYGYDAAPDYVSSTPPSMADVHPAAQVYAGGGTVDDPWRSDDGEDDLGAGRFTLTPEERRTARERRISRHVPATSEEWTRFSDRHHFNPLSYGMEALARLDRLAGHHSSGNPFHDAADLFSPIQHDLQDANPGWGSRLGDAALSVANLLPFEHLATSAIKPAAAFLAPLLGGVSASAGQEVGNALLGDDGSAYAAEGHAGGGLIERGLSQTLRDIRSKFGSFQGQRAEHAADLTNLDRYSDQAVRDMFDSSKPSGLYTAMPPGDFQDYALRLPSTARDMVPYPRWPNVPPKMRRGVPESDQTLDHYLDFLANTIDRQGVDGAGDSAAMPSLWMYRTQDPLTAIEGHEGRHRMMALERMGDDRALVHLPSANEGEMRGSPEERVQRLQEKYFPRGGNQLVLPEAADALRRIPRPIYSEPFSEGGSVLSRLTRHALGKPKTMKLPSGEQVEALPIKEFEDVAEKFARRYGNQYPIDEYPKFDEDRARKIAEAYEAMQHNPGDPAVKRAYEAMIDETMDQYRALEGTGARFEFMKPGESDPYAASPSLGYMDLVNNGRLKVFPTEQGFGTLNDISDNPLLRRVGRVGDLDNATANDAFRVVHDALGHFGPGNPFFRHQGEERAWNAHSRSYSPDALPAATSETRGQNSWVNFGPHADANRAASGADTVYADQKTGLLPEWMYRTDFKEGGSVVADAVRDLVKKSWKTNKAEELDKLATDLNRKSGSDEFISPPINKRLQTVSDPRRVMFPGIYKDPRDLIGDANARYIPDPGKEGPMYHLFGHTRDSLDELAQDEAAYDAPFRRLRITEPPWQPPLRGTGAAVSDQVLTRRNSGRLSDILDTALEDPSLRTTRSWYEMKPFWDQMRRLGVPTDGPLGQRAFNTRMGVMSAGSDPETEINRGVLANYLAHEGRIDDFVRYGGVPAEQRGDWFPADMAGMRSHAYHSTAQVPNLLDFETTGDLWSENHKVPTYVAATDPVSPYSDRPVADSHFGRALGYPDVRAGKNLLTLRSQPTGSEYADLVPWWQRISEGHGLRPRDAQALLWNVAGPQTGVRYIGPSKLEMISNFINASSHRLGVAPEEARDMIMTGRSPGFLPESRAPRSRPISNPVVDNEEWSPILGREGFAKGGEVDDDLGLYHSMFFNRGGSVDDDMLAYNSAFYQKGGFFGGARA